MLYQRDYGLAFDPNQVLISNGAKHSIHNVLTALCGPGDEVIIPTPYWVSYSALVELTGATPVLVETTEASGFCLSAEQFAAAITPKTQTADAQQPLQPDRSGLHAGTSLKALADVAVEKNVLVLSDEIYEKLIYEGSEFRCFATLRPGGRRPDDHRQRRQQGLRDDRLADRLDASPRRNSPRRWTTCKARKRRTRAASASTRRRRRSTARRSASSEMLKEFAKRRDYVMERLEEMRPKFGLTFAEPGGAFYAFFNVAPISASRSAAAKSSHNATDFCTALLEEKPTSRWSRATPSVPRATCDCHSPPI